MSDNTPHTTKYYDNLVKTRPLDTFLREVGLVLRKSAKNIRDDLLSPGLAQYLAESMERSVRREKQPESPAKPRRGGSVRVKMNYSAYDRLHGIRRPEPPKEIPLRQRVDALAHKVDRTGADLLQSLTAPGFQGRMEHLDQRIKDGKAALGAGLSGVFSLTDTCPVGEGAPADLFMLLQIAGALGGAADKAQKGLEHTLSAALSVFVSGGLNGAEGAGSGDATGAGSAPAASPAAPSASAAASSAVSAASPLEAVLLGLSGLSGGSPLPPGLANMPQYVPPAPAAAAASAKESRVDLGVSVSGVNLSAHGVKEILMKEVRDNQKYELGRLVANANKGVF